MCNHGERHETSGSEWWGSEKAGGEKMEERATSHTAERSTRLTLSAGAKTTCSNLSSVGSSDFQKGDKKRIYFRGKTQDAERR